MARPSTTTFSLSRSTLSLVRFRLVIVIIGLISLLAMLAQIIFQSVLLIKKPYGHTLTDCTTLSQILRYIGLER